MSCNCTDTNKCPTPTTCLCGIETNIYNPSGVLVEAVTAYPVISGLNTIYEIYNSTAFQVVLGQPYTLTIAYNTVLDRWEVSYFNDTIDEDVVIGVYSTDDTGCPAINCWDLDCIAVAFRVLGAFDTYFAWVGDYTNGKKSYEFTSDWSGPDLDYSISWGLAPVSAGAPAGTNCWTLVDETSGIPSGYLFNSNKCPYGVYLTGWGQAPSRFSFTDLGATGFDLKTSIIDCGCCDESILVDITFEDVQYTDIEGSVVKDEYGNVIAINGYQYYELTIPSIPNPMTFYLYFNGDEWSLTNGIEGEIIQYAKLESNSECPFGIYDLFKPKGIDFLYIRGAKCFDCCDYDTPKNRNLLKKKKAIFVEEISSIRNKEIFGLKCGTEWDDLFRKHLIFDVLWCLPYGKICDEEQQCLINNLNENCNC
jgi:hypothetical protein